MQTLLSTLGQQRRIKLLCVLLLWCGALIGFRMARTGTDAFLFLLWNLFLACIPLLASRVLRAAHDKRRADFAQLALLTLWLLFLPNAPYIFTDLIHLQPSTPLLYGYDLALLLSCAGTGLLLGYSSLIDVHTIFAERFGRRIGWTVAVVALLLTGYGIYLGRVQRFNSWDIVTNPRGLFSSIAEFFISPSEHVHVHALSALISVVLLFGYAAVHAALHSHRPQRVCIAN